MAKLKLVVPKPVVRETKVNLTLTLKEAFYLERVLSSVGGISSGPRGQMDNILDELQSIQGELDSLGLSEYTRGAVYLPDTFRKKS